MNHRHSIYRHTPVYTLVHYSTFDPTIRLLLIRSQPIIVLSLDDLMPLVIYDLAYYGIRGSGLTPAFVSFERDFLFGRSNAFLCSSYVAALEIVPVSV